LEGGKPRVLRKKRMAGLPKSNGRNRIARGLGIKRWAVRFFIFPEKPGNGQRITNERPISEL
jgi:hypothetical protein